MVNPNEAQAVMIEVCRNIVENFADKYQADQLNLNIRIDMENTAANPVFGIFDKSRLVGRHTLQEVIATGASDLPPMVRKMLTVPVRDAIAEMFKQAMKGYEVQDSKELFILLHLKACEPENMPMISIYLNGEKKDSALISERIGVANGNT